MRAEEPRLFPLASRLAYPVQEMPAMSKPDVVSTPLPEYLTAQQTARFLRCTPQTVRNWCKRGLLPQAAGRACTSCVPSAAYTGGTGRFAAPSGIRGAG